MGVAIGIASNNATNIHITNLWHKVGELEDVPSMQSLKYPPHFTFAIYQNIDMVKFREDLNGVFDDFRQIRIVFDQIRFFNASPLILWASPKENSELLELHSAIHAKIDLSKCDELYRPQHWGTGYRKQTEPGPFRSYPRKWNHLKYCSIPLIL